MSILLAVIGGFLFVLGAAFLTQQDTTPPMPQVGAFMIFASIGFIIWAVLA